MQPQPGLNLLSVGGPLLGGGGLPTLFDWNPEVAQALPVTATFTRASVKQVLTTTDGTKWYQEAKIGEVPLDGLRRVEQFLGNVDWAGGDVPTTWTSAGAGTTTAVASTGPGANAIQFVAGTSQNIYLNKGSAAGVVRSGEFWGIAVFVEAIDDATNTNSRILRAIAGGGSAFTPIIEPTVGNAVAGSWIMGVWEATASGNINARIGINDASGAGGADITISSPIVFKSQDTSGVFGDWVNDALTNNSNALGVKYFNTENANSRDVNGVVTLATGATIVGGGYLPHSDAENRLLHSNDLTDAAWVKNGAAGAADLGVTDIGGQSSRLTGIGALGVDDVVQTATGFTASGPIAPSFLLRRVSTTGTLRIVQATDGATGGDWDIDLSAIGAGWVRIEPGSILITENTAWTASGAGAAGVTFAASAGGPLSVDIAFVGQEDTVFATSRIVTAGSTETSAGDLLVDQTWTAEHSAFVDLTGPVIITASTRILTYDAAFGLIFASAIAARVINSGIFLSSNDGAGRENKRQQLAYSLKDNEGILATDAGPTATDNAGTIVLGNIRLGSDISGTNQTRGRIHRAVVWSATQTQAELEALVA